MILTKGGARKYREAETFYVLRYPDRQHPFDNYFPWLKNNFSKETILNENRKKIKKQKYIYILISVGIDHTSFIDISCKYFFKNLTQGISKPNVIAPTAMQLST